MTHQALLLTALSLSSILALPQNVVHNIANNDNDAMETCSSVMERNGINLTTFRTGAVHGIHSLYLEEIRHFFEPDAPAKNGIPVVNPDLTAQEMILQHSPLAGYDNDFNTMALKVMAFFMLNDGSNFYMQGTNALERISHQYHMHEIYTAAAPIYHRLKDNPPSDPRLCPCSNDIYGNGIFADLVGTAEILKSFAAKPSEQDCHPQYEELSETDPKLFVYNYALKTKQNENDPKLSFYETNLETEPSEANPKLFVYNYDLETKQNENDPKLSFYENNLDTELSETDPKLFVYNYDLKTKQNENDPKLSFYESNLDTEPSETDPKLFVYNYDFKTKQNENDPKLFSYHYNFKTEPSQTGPKRCQLKANDKGNISSKQVDDYKKQYLKESNQKSANKVIQVDPWQPNTLVGPAQWVSYEAMLTSSMLEEEEIKDFATFIYCKLNVQ